MFKFSAKKSNRTFPVATRVVRSHRWIHRNQLEVGMYVRELDVAWEDTHFMFQGFVVENKTLLREVKAASEWVCVETQKLARISASSTNRLCGASRL